MRIVAMFFVILGVALAGGAIYFGNEYLNSQASMATQAPAIETVNVVAAAERLNFGDEISSASAYSKLKFVTWPKDVVPPGAFTTNEALLGESGDQTRTVLRTIEPGELILQSKVSGFGESVRLATQVAAGKRAFTLPIDAVSGVAGLIAPGDRVDILLTRTIEREMKTSVVLQNILVIAIDQTANTENARARLGATATVEVDPTEAQKLTLAQQVGRLTLTLRGVNESVAAPADPVGVSDLPDQPEQVEAPVPEAAPAPVAPTTVKVRKGGGPVQEVVVD